MGQLKEKSKNRQDLFAISLTFLIPEIVVLSDSRCHIPRSGYLVFFLNYNYV
jgi:hypothetical protein